MTITSRGAVAPTGERAGTGNAAAAAGAAPPDTGALNAIVDEVADSAASWAQVDAAARADLLQQVITDTMAVQDEWLAAACAAKGLRPGTTEAGEELFSGIGTFVRMARLQQFAAIGAESLYLQVLDLNDLEHIDLLAEEVLPRVV